MGMREEWGHFLHPQSPIICTQHCRAGNIPGFQRNCGSHCRAGQGREGNIPGFHGFMAPSSWNMRFSQEHQDLQAGRAAILRLHKMFVNLSFSVLNKSTHSIWDWME